MSNVYYQISETDCDHCCIEYVKRFGSHREARRYYDSLGEHAEGPIQCWRVDFATYLDYREHGRQMRDYALEAHENGHPYSIRHY